MNAAERAWAAGLFEGEGSVRISKPAARNWGSLNVDIVNTDEALARFFSKRWSGTVHRTAACGRRRAFWRWRCPSLKAAQFLADILPFLQSPLKRARVEEGLAFQAQKHSRHGHHDEVYREEQWNAYWRMARLNQRGNTASPEAP